ncbi:MAG TPA: gamma-glutamyl-gamma-aminobutyrate hydrolase family protein [Clostridiaceae bacterium]|nr:gamma-glutamyl-gamma-aminobutyrate hydrolase family protein [Clostridiaceae bacterium]
MSKYKPLIGVTPFYDYEKKITYIKHGYMEGIAEAGGLGVLLPLMQKEDELADICKRLDGFLISGGPDIDAGLFGEENLPFNGEISPLRDSLEIFIAREAIRSGKPILGICRGIQVLNVALGGTLYQDIYSQIKNKVLIKHSQNAPKWYPTHCIAVEEGSKVWTVYKRERVCVNSFHHQAIKDVADGFLVTSRTSDGIIESIEHAKHVFAVGVQWHPELMWEKDKQHLGLFTKFIEAAAVFSAGK